MWQHFSSRGSVCACVHAEKTISNTHTHTHTPGSMGLGQCCVVMCRMYSTPAWRDEWLPSPSSTVCPPTPLHHVSLHHTCISLSHFLSVMHTCPSTPHLFPEHLSLLHRLGLRAYSSLIPTCLRPHTDQACMTSLLLLFRLDQLAVPTKLTFHPLHPHPSLTHPLSHTPPTIHTHCPHCHNCTQSLMSSCQPRSP